VVAAAQAAPAEIGWDGVMRRMPFIVRFLLIAGLVLLSVGVARGLSAPTASAVTDSSTLTGEGGTFFEPIVNKLMNDDAATLAPLNLAYLNVDLDQGISDFVGTGPGQFNADFALSERPLTATEAQTATTDGRSFAYVPIAATPVAIATLVPLASYTNNGTINSTDLCPHIDLTVDQIGAVFGYDSADPAPQWNDARLAQPTGGCALEKHSIQDWANNDPTMENYALMALLDSDTTATTGSKALFDAGLTQAKVTGGLLCSDTPVTDCDAASETWPLDPQNQVPGGDETFLAKVIGIDQSTNAPSTASDQWQLGAVFPISSVWTGSPLGVTWDIPTVAVQNAQGSFVFPAAAAAAAAESDATMASTSDPTTNNLVTFNANATDAAAYNNYLMLEDYLVVPTKGLSADKATALAQFVRFILGAEGQKDITSFGAASATPAMVTAGLKVAAQLNAEAIESSTSTTSASSTTTTSSTTATTATTTTTGSSTTTTSAAGGSAGSSTGSGSSSSTGSDSGVSSSSASGTGDGSGGSLAFTGTTVWPLVTTGLTLVLSAEVLRRRFRKRRPAT